MAIISVVAVGGWGGVGRVEEGGEEAVGRHCPGRRYLGIVLFPTLGMERLRLGNASGWIADAASGWSGLCVGRSWWQPCPIEHDLIGASEKLFDDSGERVISFRGCKKFVSHLSIILKLGPKWLPRRRRRVVSSQTTRLKQ